MSNYFELSKQIRDLTFEMETEYQRVLDENEYLRKELEDLQSSSSSLSSESSSSNSSLSSESSSSNSSVSSDSSSSNSSLSSDSSSSDSSVSSESSSSNSSLSSDSSSSNSSSGSSDSSNSSDSSGSSNSSQSSESSSATPAPPLTTVRVWDNTGNSDNLNLGWQLFNDIEVGDSVQGGLVRLYNEGPNTLTLHNAWTLDVENYFVKLNKIEAEVGDYCEVEIIFSPTVEGELNTFLEFSMNTETSPTVEIYGNGVAAPPQSSSSSESSASSGSSVSPDPEPESSSSSESSSSESSYSPPAPGDNVLVPGSGWDADLEQPAQIGDTHEIAVARWDVVPFQIVNEPFEVGVCAAHLDGIDRVEISVDNGPWVAISEEKYNPRTKVEEYFAILDPSKFTEDKLVELRAIAYPKKGTPKIAEEIIKLNVNPNGTLDHEYILLDAGSHVVDRVSGPEDRWLIYKPKPGVAKEDVVLTLGKNEWGNLRPGKGNVKYESLVWKMHSSHWMYSSNNAQGENCIWADDVRFDGHEKMYRMTRNMGGTFLTNSYITGIQAGPGTHSGSKYGKMIRNMEVGHVFEDFARTSGLYLNISIELIDRTSEYTSYHADFFQARNVNNTYMKNVTLKLNMGQGIFPGQCINNAFINVELYKGSAAHQLHLMGESSNLLFKDCMFGKPGKPNTLFRYDKGFYIPDGERIVFIDTEASQAVIDNPQVEYRITQEIPDPEPDPESSSSSESSSSESSSTPVESSASSNSSESSVSNELNLDLPINLVSWTDVREHQRPPQPDNISQVISATDPDLKNKLKNHTSGSWLVVRGDESYPFNNIEFSGWVKLEVPKLKIGWEFNAVRGKSSDDKLWIENCHLISYGANTIFYALQDLYADRCVFEGFRHTIVDLNSHANFGGAVINSEFRKQREDPFQNYTGDVINVSITSFNHEPGGHADLAQWVSTGITDIYWRSIYCGTEESPFPTMGLRGYDVKNSWFEDVRHYQYPGTGHHSVAFHDATGTTFKNCIFTGQIERPGAIVIDDTQKKN